MFKLSPLTFVVCGVVLIAVTWAGFWFLSIGKIREEITGWEEHNEQLRQIVSDTTVRRVQERVRKALEKVHQAQVQWKQIAATRTPSMGRINLAVNRWQLTVNARRWHPTVERDLRRWILRSGVRVIAPVQDGQIGPFVPYPTENPNELVEFYFNYPALPFPVCVWDLGEITVEGTFDQILNHVRSWSRIPGYVACARGLAITGTGSRLKGTYNLIVVAFINTPSIYGGTGDRGAVPDLSTAASGGEGTGTAARPAPGAGPGGPTSASPPPSGGPAKGSTAPIG